jgi:hypothetical protein
MLGPMRGKPPMAEIDVYHGSPHRFEPEETLTVYRGENTANKGGNYWTGDPEFARQFTQSGLENEIKRSTLSTADVYTPPTPVFAGDAKGVDAAIAEAKRLGKSVVRLSEGKSQPDSFYVVEKTALGRTGNPFGAFNASKIGTGEGAQAFGHGIYLAESPDIAKHYRKQLGKFYDQVQTPEGMMPLEEAVTKYHPDGAITAKVLTKYRGKTDVNSFNKLIDDQIVPEMRAQYPQSEWEKFKPQQGNLYTADLPDEMVDRMLDWDKPLSEQPEAVRKALRDVYNADWLGDESKQTGQDLYKRMGKMHGDDIAAVSRDLRDIGIPGIRYLDAGSRGQGGSGTRNFVVFPGEEKKVKILKRE